MTWALAVQLAFLLALSASLSAAEAAMLSINKVRLRHLMEQGHRGAQLTFTLLTQLDHVIGTLLVANNLVNVAISAVGAWIFIELFGSERGLLLATLVVTSVLLLIGEVTPKLFAATHAELVAFAMAWPLRVLMTVLYPVAAFFTWASRLLLRLARIPTRRRSPLVTEEEIKVMIQMGREAGVLAEEELRMLHRIFEFSDSTVRDIMIPRAQIAGIDLNATPSDVLDVLIEEGHSRIPVYRGSLDDVAGVLYARDLLAMVRHGGLFVLADLIRPVAVIPASMRLAELLSAFQRDKTQIAIVQDQQRQTIGLVTIEDLLEEIVGEIREDVPKRSP
jgi:CBS domain containing-hemolysin-like protein